jgi:hypothetical protein
MVRTAESTHEQERETADVELLETQASSHKSKATNHGTRF